MSTPESKFLHELSNPISALCLILDSVVESMESRPDHNPTELKHIKKAVDSVNALTKLIARRKGELTHDASQQKSE